MSVSKGDLVAMLHRGLPAMCWVNVFVMDLTRLERKGTWGGNNKKLGEEYGVF